MKKILFLFLGVLWGSISVVQAATYPPSLKWRQKTTDHFVFVYADDLPQDVLQNVVTIAEEEYAVVTAFLRSEVRSKIYFVITDQYDQFNGSTTVIPQNRVEIFLTPALNGNPKFLWDTRTEDSLRLLIHHELVHAVQLNERSGFFKFLRAATGTVSSPNLFLPPNFVEGLAVKSETDRHNGRGAGTLYEMVLRSDVLEHDLPKLDEVMVYSRPWLRGLRVYLYGYKFLDFLADTYGEAKLADLVHVAGRRFPLFVTGAFTTTYGRSVRDLWRDWQNTLPDFYEKQKRELLKDGESVSTSLFESGGLLTQLALSPDAKTLYFQWAGTDQAESLVAFDLRTQKQRILSKGVFAGKLSVTADGKTVYYSKLDIFGGESLFADVYAYDLVRNREKRITHGARASDVAVFPDGSGLIYVTLNQGVSSLWRWDFASGQKTQMPSLDAVRLWHDPVVMPDGLRVAILGQGADGRDRIYLWDDTQTQWQVVAPSTYWMSGLSVNADGSELYFASDRVGTPNIDSYNLKTGQHKRRTAVATGAFFGVASAEDLYYAEFAAKGFVLKKTAASSQFGRSLQVAKPKGVSRTPASAKPPAEFRNAADPNRYNPLPQLLKPFLYFPFWTTDEEGSRVGVSVMGGDVLLHHSYEAQVSYGFSNQRLGYNLTYVYDRLYPTFSLQVFDESNRFRNFFTDAVTGEDRDYWQRERGVVAGVRVPLFQRLKSGLFLDVTYTFDKIASLTSDFLYRRDEGGLTGHLYGFFLESTPYSLWPRQGFVFDALVERLDERLGGDVDESRFVGGFQVYVPPPFRRHALSLLAKAGLARGDLTNAFYLGGNASLAEFRPNTDFYPLRGYPARSLSGNRFAFSQIEYAFPLVYIDRGLTRMPLYADSLALKTFYEIGSAWVDDDTPSFKDSAGAELQSRFKIFNLGMAWHLGVAAGLRDTGETQVYTDFRFEF